MWKALRSDLAEFVTTVAEESTDAIQKIDDHITKIDENRSLDPNKKHSEGLGDIFLGDDLYVATNASQNGASSLALSETDRLRSSISTYTDPLTESEDSSAFKTSFEIKAATEEISQVLKTYSDVQDMFSELVPTQVTYEEFWSRYFFRCDVDRIEKKLEEEREVIRAARAEKIASSVGLVANFIGSAVSAVGKVASSKEKEVHRNTDVTPTSESPFIPHAIVPEKFEDDIDEEDLGWDDDDDDDEEEIVYDSNQSHSGIGSQSKIEEIENTDTVSKDAEIQKLTNVIVKKDAEINEIKSKFEYLSACSEGAEMNTLLSKFSEKDVEVLRLTELLAVVQSELTGKNDKLKKYENDRLEFASAIEEKDKKINESQTFLKHGSSDNQSELELCKKKIQDLTASNLQLQVELSNQRQSSVQSETRIQTQLQEAFVEKAELKKELNKLQDELNLEDSNDFKKLSTKGTRSVDDLHSCSTGVKIASDEIESPIHSSAGSPVPLATVDDAEDEWGDAWGDDD